MKVGKEGQQFKMTPILGNHSNISLSDVKQIHVYTTQYMHTLKLLCEYYTHTFGLYMKPHGSIETKAEAAGLKPTIFPLRSPV